MVDAVNSSFVYNPYVATCAYDFDDLDMNNSIYPTAGMCPMGMGTGSIFTNPMMGSGMVGAGFYGANMQPYFDNMKSYQKFYNEYYIDNAKQQRNADLRINAPLEGVNGKFIILKDKISRGEDDQIKDAYQEFAQAIARVYGPGSKPEVNARAAAMYAQLNVGTSLIEDLRENGHDSFWQSFLHTATFGLEDSRSAEDNVSEITGTPVGRKDRDKKLLGRIVGAGTLGVAAKFGKKAITAKAAAKAASTGASAKGLKKLLTTGKGTKTGIIVAALALVVSFLTDKRN